MSVGFHKAILTVDSMDITMGKPDLAPKNKTLFLTGLWHGNQILQQNFVCSPNIKNNGEKQPSIIAVLVSGRHQVGMSAPVT